MRISKTKRKAMLDQPQLSPSAIDSIKLDIQRRRREKFKIVITASTRENPKKKIEARRPREEGRLKRIPYNPSVHHHPFRRELEYLIGNGKNVLKQREAIRIMAQGEINRLKKC